MKYTLVKPLPWIDIGTMYPVNDPCTEQEAKLFNFATQFWTDNDFFEKVIEKKKVRPEEWDRYFSISTFWDVYSTTINTNSNIQDISQWNWRWTREEAEKEVRKREAIEKCRQYLVENDMLLIDKEIYKFVKNIVTYDISNNRLSLDSNHWYIPYSPYWHLSTWKNCNKFIEDMKEELLLIHKP